MNDAERGVAGEDRPLLRAAEVVNWKKLHGVLPKSPPPDSVILCYQNGIMKGIVRSHPASRVRGLYGDLYMLKRTRGRVAVAAGFGIGASVTAALVEELVALGVRRFISIGVAGGLQRELRAGDVVVCERAIAGDGVSPHYAPGEGTIAATGAVVERLSRALEASGENYVTGVTWTTDTPYREMAREVQLHREAGVLTVEMEAAALYAAGKCLRVQTGAAFVIADVLDGPRWNLDFDRARVDRGLHAIFEAALQACQEAM